MAVVEGKKTDENGERKKIEEVKKRKTEEDAEEESERTAKLQDKLISQAPTNLVGSENQCFMNLMPTSNL